MSFQSVPRRDRLAGILVVLLTGTWLLGTPAFGEEAGRVRWKTWSVKAKNCTKAMNAKIPGTNKSASSKGRMLPKKSKYKIDIKKKDDIFTATASVKAAFITEIVIKMPAWEFPEWYPEQCRSIWNDFVDRLKVHEDGHVEIFTRWDHTLRERAIALSGEYVGQGPTRKKAVADLQEKIQKAEDDLQKIINEYFAEDTEYDLVTKHGQTPNRPENRWNPEAKPTGGAKCPKECNRKPQPSGEVHAPSRDIPVYKYRGNPPVYKGDPGVFKGDAPAR